MKRLTIIRKKWLLSFHVVFISAFFGVLLVNLLLSLTAMSTKEEEILKAALISLNFFQIYEFLQL